MKILFLESHPMWIYGLPNQLIISSWLVTTGRNVITSWIIISFDFCFFSFLFFLLATYSLPKLLSLFTLLTYEINKKLCRTNL
jgi:hypothetical protein